MTRPRGEQRHGVAVAQRGHREDVLARKREALAARDAQARPVDRREVGNGVGDAGQEVLGVVDHHQDVSAAQALAQRGRGGLTAGGGDLQRLRDRREDELGVVELRERVHHTPSGNPSAA